MRSGVPNRRPPYDGGMEPTAPPAPLLLNGEADSFETLRQLRGQFTRFMLTYRSGINEVTTKLSILSDEFVQVHRYNPIEHVSSRLKSPDSIMDKVLRKGIAPRFDAIGDQIHDIAGVRVTCSFTSDVYRVFDLFSGQSDVTVVEVKDYIAAPKPNGYRSLHAIVDVPIFLSTGQQTARVEVQLRTIAMDFWASLEHKIFYKYRGAVPDGVQASLTEAATTAARLDDAMERLHRDVHGDADDTALDHETAEIEVPAAVLQRLMQLREQEKTTP